MEELIIFVGMDVHKATITVALAEGGALGEVREHGRIANTPEALRRLLGKLTRDGAVLRRRSWWNLATSTECSR